MKLNSDGSALRNPGRVGWGGGGGSGGGGFNSRSHWSLGERLR